MIKLKAIMENILDEETNSLIDQIYMDYPAYMKDIQKLLSFIKSDKNIHPSVSKEVLIQLIR
jgi:hypothetical protein